MAILTLIMLLFGTPDGTVEPQSGGGGVEAPPPPHN